ncbi:YbaN family protein [Anaerosporobacter sp.]
MNKIKDSIFTIVGLLCVALGSIGILLPILPTTPFFVLAAVMFGKGSKGIYQWFLSTKMYQKHVASFVQSKSMTAGEKVCLLGMVTMILAISTMIASNWWVRGVLLMVAVFHYYYFLLKIKTTKDEQ